ncbi:SCO family protein [Candidatus Acetothermia bacterium]|nr:SCO family protein [Candidatus Acetothermia bacterium]
MRLNLKWMILLSIVVAGLEVGLLVSLLLARFNGRQPSSHSGPQTAYEGTELEGLAPGFRFVDQNGASMALSDFRGWVVVLTFLDNRCQDVCPLTALHLRLTYERLKREGVDASHVVFLGVNVNVEANKSADVMKFTKEYGLDRIPTWHFLTGAREELEPVWKAYAITVYRPQGEEGEIVHTPGVFLIDQRGDKRWYISTPLYDESSTAPWTGPVLSDLLVKQIKRLIKPGN